MKNRYTVDEFNRLVIKQRHKRLVTDGRFSVDSHNRLVYWLNEPASWQRQYDLLSKICFKGNWQLNKNYDLELNLIQTDEQYKSDCLVIKGEIISVDRDTLVFEIKSYDKQGLCQIQILKLAGFWQADKYNRLCFVVKKKTSPDILTLEGAWQINQNQQIIYIFNKTDLKTKTKTSDTLTFVGFWQINSANRLTYILERSSASRFDFRVQLESPNLYPQEGVIKYRLGIGLKQKRQFQTKTVSLYGIWKFNRNFGLSFIMDYGQGRVRSIEFDTDVYLTQKDKVSFSLTNKRKEPLGLCIIFSHNFLKRNDARTFLRLKKFQKELGIDAGLRIPF